MKPERILVIQLRRIGDVIFTLPVPGVLRENFPSARIDFLVEKPADQLVRLHPSVDQTVVYDRRRGWDGLRRVRAGRYDWVLDFHANGRTLLLTFLSGARLRAGFDGPVTRRLAYNHRAATTDRKYLVEQKLDLLRSLGLRADSWRWGLQAPAADKNWAREFFRDSGLEAGKVVGLAPASRRATRAWIEERYAPVVRGLTDARHSVLFLWGPGEEAMMRAISKASGLRETSEGIFEGRTGRAVVPPPTSLLRLMALIERCSAVLAVDNGPKNLAVALGVPTLSIMGPTNPLSFNPNGDPRHRVLRDDKLACIGCGLNACPYRHECMANIAPDAVLNGIQDLLKDEARRTA